MMTYVTIPELVLVLEAIEDSMDALEKSISAYPEIKKREGMNTRDEEKFDKLKNIRLKLSGVIDNIKVPLGEGDAVVVGKTDGVKSPGAIYEFEMGKSKKEEEVANIVE